MCQGGKKNPKNTNTEAEILSFLPELMGNSIILRRNNEGNSIVSLEVLECLVKLNFLSHGQGCAACARGLNSLCPETLWMCRNQVWLIPGVHLTSCPESPPQSSWTSPGGVGREGFHPSVVSEPLEIFSRDFPGTLSLSKAGFEAKLRENSSGSSHKWYQTC